MVSILAIVCMLCTFLITFLLPIVLLLWYCIHHRKKRLWEAAALGIMGFVIPQLVIRIPLLQFLSGLDIVAAFAAAHFVPYALILGVTAGLFETAGRYAVAKVLERRELLFHQGIAAGLGHGGVESVVLVGMTYINNLFYALLINSGMLDKMLELYRNAPAEMGFPAELFTEIQIALVSTSPMVFLLAGYERILTICLHVFLSLLMCRLVAQKRDVQGILLCLGIHSTVDCVTGLAGGLLPELVGDRTSYFVIYGFLTVVAAACVVGIWTLYRKEQKA